jgi:hypothetical protein
VAYAVRDRGDEIERRGDRNDRLHRQHELHAAVSQRTAAEAGRATRGKRADDRDGAKERLSCAVGAHAPSPSFYMTPRRRRR